MPAPSKFTFVLLIALACPAYAVGELQAADQLAPVLEVELQPLQAQARRVAAALGEVGQPLSPRQQEQLTDALESTDRVEGVAAIQKVFDPLCLAQVTINPEGRVGAAPGPAPRELVQQGWTVFLIKVHNEAGVTAPLRCTSPHAAPLFKRSTGSPEPEVTIEPNEILQRWMDVALYDRRPLTAKLSGLAVEYCLVEIYSRDAGKREARLVFDVGQGTQDLGFRSEVSLLFDCRPAVEVRLEVIDDDGRPTTGQFVIRDARGRVYPSRARRLAPDFYFQDQIYRQHGESILLPAGKYDVIYTRGPEYLVLKREMIVPPGAEHRERFRLKRWIHLASQGWFSGDHHIHAAGCGHYESPTQGVMPEHMMRHIVGEDLNVGCILSWGPCWYYQKQFFQGETHALSTDRHLMRYDVEVSGFPSSHAGHLVLLRLKEDDYPGATRIDQWPSWDLPILTWAKEQGGVVGFAHTGWGLKVDADSLPTYEMPPFDGIGANEYIVDVTHGMCDFISTIDTPAIWELNIWYHTLNCGATTRISGETDFPCIYGERVGLGRSYVKLPMDQPIDFDRWVAAMCDGRSYVSDGLSHLFDFRVNELGVGEAGAEDRPSVLNVQQGEPLEVRVRAAALLEKQPIEEIRETPLDERPYWHVERARVGDTRQVRVELIVNGHAVDQQKIEADGSIHDLTFNYTPTQSSWIALRIFPSSHTNPVFVELDGQPIRASKKSAQWCLDAVDVCWKEKQGAIRPAERPAAAAAYVHARTHYRKVIEEATVD